MKKYRTLQTTILAAVMTAVSAMGGAAVQAEEAAAGSTRLENIFYTYSKDNLLKEYYDANYLLATATLEQKSYDGFLTVAETDLNWDGSSELLAVRLKPQTKEGVTINTLVAEIYQNQGNTLKRITQYTLAEGILANAEASIDVFLVDTQNGQLVCCEAKDKASILADGIQWSLRAALFDGTQLIETENQYLLGSAFEPEDLGAALSGWMELGVEPEDVVWTPAADQVPLNVIASIDRYMIVDHETVMDFINNGGNGQSSMQYAETCFYNEHNPEWENKLPKDFFAILEQQNLPGNGDASGDYILADSNTRLLTQEDLAALTEEQLLIARNEIYARHGRMFNNAELDNYFRSKSWYQPTINGADFDENYANQVFNEIEIANINAIVAYEKAHGLNDFE